MPPMPMVALLAARPVPRGHHVPFSHTCHRDISDDFTTKLSILGRIEKEKNGYIIAKPLRSSVSFFIRLMNVTGEASDDAW